MPITRKEIVQNILAAMPGDLKPFAKLIVPVLLDMAYRDGLDPVRVFVHAYTGSDRSWDRKLTRNMSVKQRIRWRQITSDNRVAELEEFRVLRMRATALRRKLVQRIMTTAIEIAIGVL